MFTISIQTTMGIVSTLNYTFTVTNTMQEVYNLNVIR